MTIKERIIDVIEKRITEILRFKELYKIYPHQYEELLYEKVELEKVLEILKNKNK
jgi:hypothetical protein